MDNRAEISKKKINKDIFRLGSSKTKKNEITMIYFWSLISKKVS